MPTAAAEQVKALLEHRHHITDKEQKIQWCRFLFDLALSDSDAAEALLATPNRFVQIIPEAISREKLLKFAATRSEALVNKLIIEAGLSSHLKEEMLQAAARPKNLDQKFDAIRNMNRKQDGSEGRTLLAIQNNRQLQKKDNSHGIMVNNEFIPMVDRNTRDFNKKLCSVGASKDREVIFLDPEDELLKKLYERLKNHLPSPSNPEIILDEIKKLTQRCFKEGNPDPFIENNLKNGKKIISLSEFIRKGQGVCRHHTLLNAYFLSRLVKDGVLEGQVIHHRQDFAQEGAHTWNIFQAQNGKVYSLDSLWNNVTCITDNPGAINSLYGHDVEKKINEMHFPVPPIRKQSPREQLKSISTPADKIDKIKKYIENSHFPVGNYFLWKGGLTLNLDDGRQKRLPHRVYEIYKAIQNDDYSNLEELWGTIKTHAENALNNPRRGRNTTTTTFYENIVNERVELLESTTTTENKFSPAIK